MLVEDDPVVVTSVQQPQICHAICVSEQHGMTGVEMAKLRRLTGVFQVHSSLSAAAAAAFIGEDGPSGQLGASYKFQERLHKQPDAYVLCGCLSGASCVYKYYMYVDMCHTCRHIVASEAR